MTKRISFLTLFLCIAFFAAKTSADEPVSWTHWRGNLQDGNSPETGLPASWSEETGENILWVKPIPPWGNNTPVIWENRIFLTTQTNTQSKDGELLLLCLDRQTGDELWRRKIGVTDYILKEPNYWGKAGEARKVQQFHDEHNLATPSCVTDGEIVVCHFGDGELAAFTIDGEPLWQLNMQKMFGPFTIWWGHGNSPIIYENFVIIPALQDPCQGIDEKDVDSYIVAFDKKTGEIAWKTLRNVGVDKEPADAYITPPIQEINGRPQMLVVAGLCADAYDPRTGERIWWYPDMIGNRNVSSPTFAGEIGVFIHGHQRGFFALPLTKEGQLTEDDVLWSLEKNAPDSSTPTFYDNTLFMVNNGGIAQCVDAKTGDVHWTKRLQDAHRASPVVADGKVYFLSMKGRATVMSASADEEELGIGQVNDTTFASPVIVDGKIYLRGREKLYCIGVKE